MNSLYPLTISPKSRYNNFMRTSKENLCFDFGLKVARLDFSDDNF